MSKERVGPLPHSWDAFMPEPLFHGGMVIKDNEVEVFLFYAAAYRQLAECTITNCHQCEAADRFWWDWCNSLIGPSRVRLQRELKERGIPLPPHPGDDLPTN